MNLSRRSFIGGLFAAPAIVTASNLMPIKVLPFEPYMLIRGIDLTTGEQVERRLYEKGKLDDFVSADFLDRYEQSTWLMRDVETAVAETREAEKDMKFIRPATPSTWWEDAPIRHEIVPTIHLGRFDSFDIATVTSSDPEFYMDTMQLTERGYYRC